MQQLINWLSKAYITLLCFDVTFHSKECIIGASLSEPHTDDDIESRVLYIYYYILYVHHSV